MTSKPSLTCSELSTIDTDIINANFKNFKNFISFLKDYKRELPQNKIKKLSLSDGPLLYLMLILLNHQEIKNAKNENLAEKVFRQNEDSSKMLESDQKLKFSANYNWEKLTKSAQTIAKTLWQYYKILTENNLQEFFIIDVESSNVAGNRIGFKIERPGANVSETLRNVGEMISPGMAEHMSDDVDDDVIIDEISSKASLILSPTSSNLIKNFEKLSIINATESQFGMELAKFELFLSKNFQNFKRLKMAFKVYPKDISKKKISEFKNCRVSNIEDIEKDFERIERENLDKSVEMGVDWQVLGAATRRAARAKKVLKPDLRKLSENANMEQAEKMGDGDDDDDHDVDDVVVDHDVDDVNDNDDNDLKIEAHPQPPKSTIDRNNNQSISRQASSRLEHDTIKNEKSSAFREPEVKIVNFNNTIDKDSLLIEKACKEFIVSPSNNNNNNTLFNLSGQVMSTPLGRTQLIEKMKMKLPVDLDPIDDPIIHTEKIFNSKNDDNDQKGPSSPIANDKAHNINILNRHLIKSEPPAKATVLFDKTATLYLSGDILGFAESTSKRSIYSFSSKYGKSTISSNGNLLRSKTETDCNHDHIDNNDHSHNNHNQHRSNIKINFDDLLPSETVDLTSKFQISENDKNFDEENLYLEAGRLIKELMDEFIENVAETVDEKMKQEEAVNVTLAFYPYFCLKSILEG